MPVPQLPELRPETEQERAYRVQRNHRRSVMRSRVLLTDYAMEYKLCFLWTLTYKGDGQHSWEGMTEDVRQFERRMGEKYPGLPFVIVPEWHPGGHGLHLHMGLGRFIDWQDILHLWTDGGQHLLAGTVKAPKTGRGRQLPRDCARYLAKYVGKSLGDTMVRAGAKRFYRPHGQVVTIIRLRFSTEIRAYSYAVAFFGGRLPQVWDSRLVKGWEGPAVAVYDWNEPRRKPGGR